MYPLKAEEGIEISFFALPTAQLFINTTLPKTTSLILS